MSASTTAAAELGGDLNDGVHAAPVRAGLRVHLLRGPRLACGEFRFLPTGAPAGLRRRGTAKS